MGAEQLKQNDLSLKRVTGRQDDLPTRLGNLAGKIGFYGQRIRETLLTSPINFLTTSSEPPKKGDGLKPKDKRFLNGLINPSPEDEKIYAKLRAKYAGNALALEQIDAYDRNSPYSENFEEFLKASRYGDIAKQEELEGWFNEHYPLIKTTKRK